MKRFLTIGCSVACAFFTFEAYRLWNVDSQEAYACIVLAIFVAVAGITLRTD